MIFAGGGVGLSGAERELVALAERLDAPVVTTPSGRGSISEEHRLSFGLVGLYRTESSARPLDEADAVLLVGTPPGRVPDAGWGVTSRRARS